jgi:hypothetical protein
MSAARRAARLGGIAGTGLAGAPRSAASVVSDATGASDTTDASGTSEANGATGATGVNPPSQAAREAVSRFTVRIYQRADAEAWQTLRLELSRTLGRMPSLSEVAAATAAVLVAHREARDLVAERVRQSRPAIARPS